jgi:hypothetical protein
LRGVPTFCIVDKRGVPYVVVGEDAKVTGYFFTTYEEADRILKVARESADRAIREARDKTINANPWKEARISTVPLDAAATLVTKSSLSGGGSRTTMTTTRFQIAPAESDIEDALTVTGKDDLPEGKVPLFYYEDWRDGNDRSPLFFSRAQLEQSYKVQSGAGPSAAALPQLQPNVTELFAVLAQIVEQPDDAELRQLVLVPPSSSPSRAKECRRRGGKEPPFVLGQQLLVL